MYMNKTRVYTRKNYHSGNGFLTSVWGPAIWHYLHIMSFNYPVHPTQTDKRNYRKFILSLVDVLPCGKCRINLKKNFKQLPLKMEDMESRTTFSKYIYNLHQNINKMLDKKITLTYDEVRERYEHFRAQCVPDIKLRKTIKNKKHDEKGCIEPLVGKKSKCVINIVPYDTKCETFNIDEKCFS